MVQELQDVRGVPIGQFLLAGGSAGFFLDKQEQQTNRVAVTGQGMGAGLLLSWQAVAQEALD
jgi:hypothetical protein